MLALLGGLGAASSCGTPSAGAGKSAALATLAIPPPAGAVSYSVPANAGAEDLARLAIRHHPSVAAARHRAERMAAMVPQERALPDPMLDISPIGAMAETAAGSVGMMGGVSQTLPFPGKRGESAAAAEREAAAERAEIAVLELKLTEQVHSAWWDLYLAAQTVSLTAESRSVLEAIRDAVEARMVAGQAAQADQIRLSNELTLLDRDLSEAAGVTQTARARLNSLLNRPSGASLPTPQASAIPATASLEALLARAQARHPEVAAAEERASAFRHRLRRAELEKYPDFNLGLAGASVSSSGLSPVANGRDQLYATIGINLPLWQEPRRAMIREARAGIAETDAMLASTRADLRYRIEDAWFQVRTAREVMDLFENRLIPDARQAYEVTLTGYSTGTSSFTDLVETWRQTLAYRLQLSRSRAQLGKAAATLRAAAGVL
jgi:outer membrane protein, heavy metal efflux system